MVLTTVQDLSTQGDLCCRNDNILPANQAIVLSDRLPGRFSFPLPPFGRLSFHEAAKHRYLQPAPRLPRDARLGRTGRGGYYLWSRVKKNVPFVRLYGRGKHDFAEANPSAGDLQT